MESEDGGSMNRKIGARLLQRRTELGLSMSALADQMGISYQAYRRYENGEVAVSLHRLVKLASICSVPVQYFIEDVVAGGPGSESKAASPADKTRAALVQAFENTLDVDPGLGASIASLLPFIASQEGRDLVASYQKIDSPKVRENIRNLINSLANALATGK